MKMQVHHARSLTITWQADVPVKLRAIAKVLKDLPVGAAATSIETIMHAWADRAYDARKRNASDK